MRKVLFMLVLALIAVPAAAAGNGNGDGHGTPPPTPETPTLVEAPHAISVLQLPDVRKVGGIEIGTRPGQSRTGGGVTADASCGACITQCQGATWRNGASDPAGHAYIFEHVSWCGNGAVVTYAQASQTYDQAGWYRIDSTYGPWWSGGCIGCSSISATGYMTWSENIPMVFTTTGTTWLTVNMYAYGSSTGSGASAS